MMKPATEILLSAAFVLTPEENWTTHTVTRSANGNSVPVSSPYACRWCAAGALMAVVDEIGAQSEMYEEVLLFLERVIGQMPLGTYNDTRTHAEVLDALYRAAEIAEAS